MESIKTYGFRGEALSSICALSEIVIITRHHTAEYGNKLSFDHEGKITAQSICARNVGTTVIVKNFFKTLPVRKAEFFKNYRKDFTKMVQLLQEYCLVLTGVKIICTNQVKSGSRQTVLSTNGNSIMENIISIFGTKQSQEVIKIRCPTNDGSEDGIYTQESLLDIDNVLEIREKEVDNLNQARFKIEGYISNIEHSCGRSAKDRQYIYVNSRPVEIRPIIKMINEVYHRYNLKQFPFVFMNLKMEQSNVDVNLSKDKRQVAICDDKILHLVVKKSLLNTFGDLPSKFRLGKINSVVKNLNESINTEESSDDDDEILMVEPNSNFGASLKQWKINPNDPIPKPSSKRRIEKSDVHSSRAEKVQKIDSFFQKTQTNSELSFDENDESNNEILSQFSTTKIESTQSRQTTARELSDFTYKNKQNNEPLSVEKENELDEDFKISCKTIPSQNTLKFEMISSTTDENEQAKNIPEANEDLSESIDDLEKEFISLNDSQNKQNSSVLMTNFKIPNKIDKPILSVSNNEYYETDKPKTTEMFMRHKVRINLNTIKKEVKLEEEAHEKMMIESKKKSYKLKFKETIDPSKNKKAETELETEIKKEMFCRMSVIGQFNLGFIIAKLDSNLFIVDQHATDERYNFEDLQKSFKIQTQKLIYPEKLELTAIQEDIVMENIDIFLKNGFKFEINTDALPTQKIKLISRPFSKNWEFGREDIEEMIFFLQDAPKTFIRPSRITTMLASRSCRKSVMIGDALTKRQMMKLLSHMGEIDHPWVRYLFILLYAMNFKVSSFRTVHMEDLQFVIFKI